MIIIRRRRADIFRTRGGFMEEYSVDCVGDICPIPLIKAKINYGRIDIGESFTIVTDHSCSCSNIKDYFLKMNAQVSIEEEEGIWYIRIKKETSC